MSFTPPLAGSRRCLCGAFFGGNGCFHNDTGCAGRGGMWMVAQTLPFPGAMSQVMRHLDRLDFEFYNPKIWCRAKARRGFVWQQRALFPSYVFVKLAESWHAIKHLPGVAEVLMSGPETVAQIPERTINELRSLEKNGAIELRRFRKGQRVVLQSGVFATFEGMFDGVGRDGRSYVLLSVLGAMRRIPVDEGCLQLADAKVG